MQMFQVRKFKGGGQGLFEVCRKKKNKLNMHEEYKYGLQETSIPYDILYLHICIFIRLKLYNLCNIVRAVSESPSWLFSFR